VLKIASGGMATVFLGALQGELGFRQLVAIKRPHPHLLDDRGFREAWLREARLASGIHHANVVDVRDVEAVGDGIQLVMDYIEGASLGDLVAAQAVENTRMPRGVAVRVVLDACAGLHAAHEACDEDGRPMGLVHRDVSPQNILVGLDGVARVTDFGIAKCADAVEKATTQGILKGKAGYMAPEYVRGESVDRRADVFALGVVLWEALAGKRLFRGDNESDTLGRVLAANVSAVSEVDATLAPLDAILSRALARDRENRTATAEDLAHELERAATAAGLLSTHADVGRFVRRVAGESLAERRRALRDSPKSVPPSLSALQQASETPTRQEPRPTPRRRSRALIATAATIVVAGAAAAAFALGRSHTPPTMTVAGSTLSASTPISPTPSAPPTAAGDSTAVAIAPASASIVPSVPSAPSAASSSKRAPHPPRPTGTAHTPPPNPYPGNP
jgi:serine/threonine-protein kinase